MHFLAENEGASGDLNLFLLECREQVPVVCITIDELRVAGNHGERGTII